MIEDREQNFAEDEDIGREMFQLREVMMAADIPKNWVPTPAGLEQYTCVPSASLAAPLYAIGLHEDDDGVPTAYMTYTDVHGREVLPVFSRPEQMRAYVEKQTSLTVDATRPFDTNELGGLGALGVDLVVVDPDPVAHPGRCATGEPARHSFSASDKNELHRLRGVARAWAERKAQEEFGGAGLEQEDYEDLRSAMEYAYLRSDGDERVAEDAAWSHVYNAIDWDRYPEIEERLFAQENARAQERQQG